MLLEAQETTSFEHPPTTTMGEVLGGMERSRSIELLLELGALEARPIKVTAELLDGAQENPSVSEPRVSYGLSALGKALAARVMDGLLPKGPALIERMAGVIGQSP